MLISPELPLGFVLLCSPQVFTDTFPVFDGMFPVCISYVSFIIGFWKQCHVCDINYGIVYSVNKIRKKSHT